MADPVVIACDGACTVTVVHELSLPLLQLDAADGAAISSAILLVWGVGWGIRVVVQTLKNTDRNSTQEEN